jgi:hypothetical protein
MARKVSKKGIYAQIIFIALIPIIFFPVISTLSLFTDWLFESGENLVAIIYGPKQEILSQYINDWSSSIILCSIVTYFIFTPLYLFFKRNNVALKVNPIITSTLIWLSAGIYLNYYNIVGIILMGTTGLLFAIALILLQRIFMDKRRTS